MQKVGNSGSCKVCSTRLESLTVCTFCIIQDEFYILRHENILQNTHRTKKKKNSTLKTFYFRGGNYYYVAFPLRK